MPTEHLQNVGRTVCFLVLNKCCRYPTENGNASREIREAKKTIYLDWYDQRVAHQVSIDCPMEDVDSGIVTRGSKQRIRSVECHAPQGVAVIPQRLVGFIGEIKVEPGEALVF